jgi:hypothetical protein
MPIAEGAGTSWRSLLHFSVLLSLVALQSGSAAVRCPSPAWSAAIACPEKDCISILVANIRVPNTLTYSADDLSGVFRKQPRSFARAARCTTSSPTQIASKKKFSTTVLRLGGGRPSRHSDNTEEFVSRPAEVCTTDRAGKEHMDCGTTDHTQVPASSDTEEDEEEKTRLRVRQETLEDHVRRIEGGERLGLADLPRDIALDFSQALSAGRLTESLRAWHAPWWLHHPFGNISSATPPDKAVRVPAQGASLEETRAELLHNGAFTTRRGWHATETPGGAEGGERWGMMWAQDMSEVVVSFAVPSLVRASDVQVDIREGGRRLTVLGTQFTCFLTGAKYKY